MKRLKSYTRLGIVVLTPLLFIGCDSNEQAGTTDEENLAQLQQPVVRGLDLEEIESNPAGIPGFPFSLSVGETIEFVPDMIEPGGFMEQIPLGILTADGAGFVRHAGGPTGNLYFPVTEQSFKLFYGMSSNIDPTTVSTQDRAFIEYSFEHRYSRVGDFIPRLQVIIQSADTPGSLQYVLINGGIVTSRDRVVIDAISSTGIAAVDHPFAGPSVRRFRAIDLTNITSTNADLAGDNPIITGTYTLTDTWQAIWTNVEAPDNESELTLDHNHNPSGAHTTDNTFEEVSTGTFIINLNALTAAP